MENRLWRYVAWFIIAIIFIVIGYGIGFGTGFSRGVEFAVRTGLHFAEINIDEEKMLELVYLYQQYCGQDAVAKCLDDLRLNGTREL